MIADIHPIETWIHAYTDGSIRDAFNGWWSRNLYTMPDKQEMKKKDFKP